MKRDSLIFYRSFYEAIRELPKETQAEVYTAIFEYSLNFEEVEMTGLAKTIFTLIRPQLEANNKRYENGNRPKKKQKISETEAKQKQEESKAEANKNENVNVNENKNEKYNFSKALLSYGFDSNLVSEWLDVRRKKKLTNSETAFNIFIKEVEKSGFDKNDVLTKCISKSWGGFEAEWLKPQPQKSIPNSVRTPDF